MALRSVVLAPPPGGAPRRTVVLRPGGPQDKGRKADLVTLVIGILLLLSCVVLVRVLPHKDYLMPQFRVSFIDSRDELTYSTQHFDFKKGTQDQKHDFTFQVPDETQSIQLVFGFKDDHPASLPDRFQVQLFDPAGNQVSTTQQLVNGPPSHDSNATNPGAAATYEAVYIESNPTFTLIEHPADEVVTGLSHTEVKEQVKARLQPQHHLPTGGVYTVRVTLQQAGDCDTSQNADLGRSAACMSASGGDPNGTDPGNDFSLNFVFTTVAIDVQNLR